MATGNVRQVLRPLRLAFLVDPNNGAEFLKAIQTNTFLWGGLFNPIIPVYKRTPRLWQDPFTRNLKAMDIVGGMIDTFDPDLIVVSKGVKTDGLATGKRETVSLEELSDSLCESGSPKYGVSLEDLLRNLVDEEYKFERRFPIPVFIPAVATPKADFTAVLYGSIFKEIDTGFRTSWKEFIPFEEPEGWSSSYLRHLSSRNLFPIRMTTLKLSWRSSSTLDYEYQVFVMDSNSYTDLIDFWNLRALGGRIIPAPVTLMGDKEYLQGLANLIERHYQRTTSTSRRDYSTLVLKSRSLKEAEFSRFRDSIPITKPSDPQKWKITQSTHFPRIWDKWARHWDEVNPAKIECIQDEMEVSESEVGISYTPLEPPFEITGSKASLIAYANEVSLTAWSLDKMYASTLPEGSPEVLFAMGANAMRNWRVSRKGAVHLCRQFEPGQYLRFPESRDVMVRWFHSIGWSVELSPAGRIVVQILKLTGGVHRLWGLANRDVIQLIQRANASGPIEDFDRGISAQEFKKSMKMADKSIGISWGPDYLAKSLLDLGIFKLGHVVQCPLCQQRSWYSLSEFDYSIVCKVCTASYDVPTHSIKDLKWHYRASGPFALPNRSEGALTVLLAMHFFQVTMHGSVCGLPCFVEKGRNIEVDLALYVDLSFYHGGSKHLLLFECKTEAPFQHKDRVRLEKLHAEFPGAILVFATLRDELGKNEKRLLRPIVNRYRRRRLAGLASNPLLILTSNELYAHWPLSTSWKHLSPKHQKFAGWHAVDTNLLELCDVSNQLYLEMDSWNSWLDHKFGKKQ